MSKSRIRGAAITALTLSLLVGLLGQTNSPVPSAAVQHPPADSPSSETPPPAVDPVPSEEPESPDPEQPGGTQAPGQSGERKSGETLECSTGTMYSVNQSGQLKRALLDEDRTGAVVSDVGSRVPNVTNFNGLGVGLDGEVAYGYGLPTGASSPFVFQYDPATGTWQRRAAIGNVSITLVGGAVDPDGTYWFGGFGNSTGFSLWSLSADGMSVQRRGQIDLRSWPLSNGNGDFSFDNQGNLYLVRGLLDQLDIFRVDAADLALGTGSNRVPVAEKLPTSVSPFRNVNGIAFDASGALYVGSAQSFGFVTLPVAASAPQPVALTGSVWGSTDLGSCGFPPTIKIEKDLPDGRLAPGDQFRLEMRSLDTLVSRVDTAGSAPGLQAQSAGPTPATSGVTIDFAESAAGTTNLGSYSTGWECSDETGTLASGEGTSGSLVIPKMDQGREISCRFTNAIAPLAKTSVPESGTGVAAGAIVKYTLQVDNSDGAGPLRVAARDYLGDVLDDAVFANETGEPTATGEPDVTVAGGLVFDPALHWNADKQWLDIRGTVASGEVGTLEFAVRVQQGGDGSAATDPGDGVLRNHFARGAMEDPPTECVPGTCTEHPVSVWTVEKTAVPAAGTGVSNGNNVHYRVVASKESAGTDIRGLVLEDDLTHVFRTAGWAPDAITPPGAKARGLYLLNEAGRSIGLDGQPNTDAPGVYSPIRDIAPPTQVSAQAPTGSESQRWLLSSGAPVDLPQEAVSAEMWFAVQVGESPAGVPTELEGGASGAFATGRGFANYAAGTAQSLSADGPIEFLPSECAIGDDLPDTSLDPDGPNPVDPSVDAACSTLHSVSENSFAIRKDVGGVGVADLVGDPLWGDDPTGLWYMTGQQFEVRDSVADGPSSYPSTRLCRTDYDPYDQGQPWRGEWLSPADAADASKWAFGAAGADIQQRIRDWNNAHPSEPLPMCGTLTNTDADGQRGLLNSAGLSEGDYWLVETRAPNAQINAETGDTRPVQGVQRLAEAIPFTVWPDDTVEQGAGGALAGRGQIDVGSAPGPFVDRCDPTTPVADRPTACVAAGGNLMVVKDQVPATLPLTGGQWLALLVGIGATVLLGALAATVVWRRRGTPGMVQSP